MSDLIVVNINKINYSYYYNKKASEISDAFNIIKLRIYD